MKRREFMALVGGAATWPLAARAQQDRRVRRLGFVIGRAENDVLSQASKIAFQEALGKFGWIEGSNLRIDVRYAADDLNRLRAYAAELVSLSPDVIVTSAAIATRAVQQQTQTIPIVFVGGGDPAVIGLVRNIARPEGNTTGFSGPEPLIASKWLELLKEAAPHMTRVAITFNTELAPTAQRYISLIEAAAPTLGVQAIKTPVRNSIDIVRA